MTEEIENDKPEISQELPIQENWNTWRIIKWVLIAFPILIFYIYNSLHTAKSIKTKN